MVILQVRQKVSQDTGELPLMDFFGKFGKYVTVSQQFFLSEDIDKAQKIRDELNKHFKEHEPTYQARTIDYDL